MPTTPLLAELGCHTVRDPVDDGVVEPEGRNLALELLLLPPDDVEQLPRMDPDAPALGLDPQLVLLLLPPAAPPGRVARLQQGDELLGRKLRHLAAGELIGIDRSLFAFV